MEPINETKAIPLHPKCVLQYEKCFKSSGCRDCFLKGCKWSPDGTCLLAASDDFHLRLFEVPAKLDDALCQDENKPILDYREGGTIYDFAWYPSMKSSDPATCVFASSSRDAPVHLWDAYTGQLRATYQPVNQYDEVHSANSLCFSPSGSLYCGFKKEIKIFDLSLPGRESEQHSLKEFQTGIISSIAFNPSASSLFALGSYDRTIGLYTAPDCELQCLLQAHHGGVTHLAFSPDGTRLYSGARQDAELLCWDLRAPGAVLFTVRRTVNTCQRIYYDLTADGRYLITGSTTGQVGVYDTTQVPNPEGYLDSITSWQAHEDCTNGISVHPSDKARLATASGMRHMVSHWSDDEDDGSEDDDVVENTVKVWQLSYPNL